MAETTFQAALLSERGGETAVLVAGPISDRSTATFAGVVRDAFSKAPRRLVINLRRVTALSPSAFAVLSTAAGRAEALSIDLVVVDPDNVGEHRAAVATTHFTT
jgi:anti-anti-sigma regulatory factor